METWQQFAEESRITKQILAMQLHANEVASGTKRAVLLYGPSGVGKSHALRTALDQFAALGRSPVYSNPATYLSLLKSFKEAEGFRPIVMEEADVIWRSERMLNILKIATDPSLTIAQRQYEGVSVTAPVLVTTNVDLKNRRKWPRILKVHGQALFRRVRPYGVTASATEICEFSNALAIHKGLIDLKVMERWGNIHSQHRPLECRIAALEWFTLQHRNLDNVSPASLKVVAEAMDYTIQAAREGELEALLVPEEERQPTNATTDIDWERAIKNTTVPRLPR